MVGTGWGAFLLGAKSLCRIHPSGSMGNFLNSGSRIPFRFQVLPWSWGTWHLSVLVFLSLSSHPWLFLVHFHHTPSLHKTWGPVALQILGIKFSLRIATNLFVRQGDMATTPGLKRRSLLVVFSARLLLRHQYFFQGFYETEPKILVYHVLAFCLLLELRLWSNRILKQEVPSATRSQHLQPKWMLPLVLYHTRYGE